MSDDVIADLGALLDEAVNAHSSGGRWLTAAELAQVRRALSAALGTHGDPCPEPGRSTCEGMAEWRAALELLGGER